MKIKICGVTSIRDARLCADVGVDYIGLIFTALSPRRISVPQARRIVRYLPRGIKTVAVFLDQPIADVRSILEETGARIAQLHGREPPAFARRLDRPVIKVFDRFTKRDLARLPRYDVFAYMLDRPKLRPGGIPLNPTFAEEAKRFGRVFLSGGLRPETVGGLIRRVRPFAVDACSCTERAPGRKDRRRLRAFVEAVRAG